MSLLDDLARLREISGKEPLPNPHVIAGFGPEDPPVPPMGPVNRGEKFPPVFDDEFLDAGPPPEPPPSPLIPRRPAPTPAVNWDEAIRKAIATTPPPMVPVPDLVVLGHTAAWKGREVLLSDADERQVRAVVLKAIQRELQADLRAAGVQRTRNPNPEPKAAISAPRKRGRPRKVQP